MKNTVIISSVFVSLCFRHVKGRVLVALADGTLAIFHRAEGLLHFTCVKLEKELSFIIKAGLCCKYFYSCSLY